VLAQIQSQVTGHPEWSIGQILIAIIVIAGCVGIAWIAVQASGIQVPPWVIRIVWIVIVVVAAVVAIRFLLSV
jgi:hypothetical protein